MKSLLSIIIFIITASCHTNKAVIETPLINKESQSCPNDGVCTFEILKNKVFIMKKDEFGNPYSELLDGNKTVLKFEYKRNTPENAQDANYSEIIYIEIDNETETLNLKDKELGKANIGFSRICFCRGQTGTYPVTFGSLNLSKIGGNNYNLQLDFKVSEVPQVITSINENFKL